MNTVSDAIAAFLDAKAAENCTPATLSWYDYMLGAFASYVPPDLPIHDVTPALIRKFLNHERGTGLSDRTVASRYDMLSTLFNWCEDEDPAFDSPIGHGRRRKVKRPKAEQKKQPAATHAQVQRLIESIEPAFDGDWGALRDLAMIRLMATSGIRRSELLGLKVPDLYFEQRVALIRGKGRKERHVPLVRQVRREIIQYLSNRPPYDLETLWLGQTRWGRTYGAMGATGIRKMLNRRCDAAGIARVSPHMLRRYCASRLLDLGADIAFVQEVLGHTDPSLTRKLYASYSKDAFTESYEEYW